MQEREAISRLKSGDIDALHVLVELHSLKALRTAYLITHDRDAADDVVQDAFLRAFDRIGSFDSARPFSPWFLRIVIRGAIDAVQQASRAGAQQVGNAAELLERIPDRGIGPEDAAEWAAQRDEVWQAIGHLPPKQRAAVVMRYYLDLSEEEMAQEMRVAPGTVKSRLYAARDRLRHILRSGLFQGVQ